MSKNLRELFVDQFHLCKLKPTETVAIVSEIGKKNDYVDAAVESARSLGAAALVLTASSLSNPVLPPYDSDGREIPALLAAASECDLVVDVTVGGLIHSDVRTRIIGAGKRMLFVAEPADVLERLIGTEELRASAEDGARRLKAGRKLHVSSEAGTDLTADISGADLPITQQKLRRHRRKRVKKIVQNRTQHLLAARDRRRDAERAAGVRPFVRRKNLERIELGQ